MPPRDSTSFDDLKNKDMQYRYSREERLKRTNRAEIDSKKRHPILQIFCGDRKCSWIFLFVPGIIGLVMLANFLQDNTPDAKTHRIFRFSDRRTAEVKLISNPERYGINIAYENKSQTVWTASNLQITLSNYSFLLNTNIVFRLDKNGFDATFIPLPKTVSNLKTLTLKLE